MKQSLIKILTLGLALGITMSGCDLFDKAKEELQEANLEEVLDENTAESDECKGYWERYTNTRDEDALTMYQKYCMETDEDADSQAEKSRPEGIKTDAKCGDLYDQAYLMADSIYFENAETCDFSADAATQTTCEGYMQPVKDLVKRLINECGVQQTEIYVRRFIEGGAVDYTTCTFPLYVPNENQSIEVKCQEQPSCELFNGKHQEKWEKSDGTGEVFVPCAVDCGPGYFYDIAAEECVYDNYQGYGQACLWDEYNAPDGTCKKFENCQEGQFFDTFEEKCKVDEWYCPMGYYKPFPESECIEDPWASECAAGEFKDAYGNCVGVQCNWDEFYDPATNSCMMTQQCAPTESFSFNLQRCVTWKECGPGQWFDIEMDMCQTEYGSGCGPNEVWSYNRGYCVYMEECAAGEFFDIERATCRLDDKIFNNKVISELTPYCSDLYVRMDGENEDNTAMQGFMRDCMTEFIQITMPPGTPGCQTLYTDIMGGYSQFFADPICSTFDDNSTTSPPANCMTSMDAIKLNVEQFKAQSCEVEARKSDPNWVFLPGEDGDDDDDHGSSGGDGYTNVPYCPPGKYWDDANQTCWEDATMTMQYIHDGDTYYQDNGCPMEMYWDENTKSCMEDDHDNGAGDKIYSRLTPNCQTLFMDMDPEENPDGFSAFYSQCGMEFKAAAIDPMLRPECKTKYEMLLDNFNSVVGAYCMMEFESDAPSATCEPLFQSFNTSENDLEMSCPEALTNPEYPYILD